MIKRFLALSLFVLLGTASPVLADSLVVAVCGTLPLAYAPGATRLDTVDINGNKCINATISGGNPAAGATGSAVPAQGSYNALNVAGTLRGQTGVNPSGSVFAGQNDTTSVNGVTVLTGTGATGTGSQRVTVATDQATNAGAALVKGGVGTVNGGSFYQAVAASQTGTTLQSSTGAAGDYLSHCVLYPTSTSPGVVTVFDNTNTAATSAILFPGGASSLSSLVPIAIPVGAVSTAGAWKVTTGASISVVCYGKFS